MTPREIGQLIVDRWRMDHGANAIMVQLIMLGAPVSQSDILKVIRAYIDAATENRAATRC